MPEPLKQPNFDGMFRPNLCEVIFYEIEQNKFQLRTRRTKDEASHIFLSSSGDSKTWSSLDQMFDFVRRYEHSGDVIIRSLTAINPRKMEIISKLKNSTDPVGGAKAEAQGHKPENYPRQRGG